MTQVDDQSRAGEVSSERSRIARLPVPSLVAALDHLDAAGLCRMLDGAARRRCRSAGSASRRGVASG